MNLRSILHCIVPAVGLLVVTVPASASPEFPEALQEATEMPCIPSCVVCHDEDPGTANTWVKKNLGIAIKGAGANKGDEKSLKAAYAKYAADPANAASVAALKGGIDPQTSAKLCSVTYGCGARVARSDPPPSDWSGLTFVGGAMLFGVLLRRFKRG